MRKIAQIFECFSESPNFTVQQWFVWNTFGFLLPGRSISFFLEDNILHTYTKLAQYCLQIGRFQTHYTLKTSAVMTYTNSNTGARKSVSFSPVLLLLFAIEQLFLAAVFEFVFIIILHLSLTICNQDSHPFFCFCISLDFENTLTIQRVLYTISCYSIEREIESWLNKKRRFNLFMAR